MTNPNDPVTVRLVGGPPDWDGQTIPCLRGDVEDRPFDDLGGMYIVAGAHVPPRGEEEDGAPRAHYAPAEGGSPYVWQFQGWVPWADGDPTPEAYL